MHGYSYTSLYYYIVPALHDISGQARNGLANDESSLVCEGHVGRRGILGRVLVYMSATNTYVAATLHRSHHVLNTSILPGMIISW